MCFTAKKIKDLRRGSGRALTRADVSLALLQKSWFKIILSVNVLNKVLQNVSEYPQNSYSSLVIIFPALFYQFLTFKISDGQKPAGPRASPSRIQWATARPEPTTWPWLGPSREHWSRNTLRKVNNTRARPMRSIEK